MTRPATVLVLGATGRVGGAVVRALAGREDIDLIAGVRTPERAGEGLRDAAEIRTLDLDDARTIRPALGGVDRALLLTGYSVGMLRQSKRFLDAAREAEVAHIVHIGASGAPTNEVEHWGWHQFVERYVEALGFGWTHLRPESFMQNLTGFGWLDRGRLTNYIGNARWSWVDCDDVAAVAAAALADPVAHCGQIYPLGVEAATMVEVAGHLTDGLGMSFDIDPAPPERFYENAIAAGGDPAYVACVLNQFRLNSVDAIPAADHTFATVEQVLARPPISWAEHIRRNRATLAAHLPDAVGAR